jgi:predicted DNA-binding ribbon-helix-helix protein
MADYASNARAAKRPVYRMPLKKRSFSLARHRTSVALEDEFWAVLEREAAKADQSLAAYVTAIDATRGMRPLASALRLAALAAAQKQS